MWKDRCEKLSLKNNINKSEILKNNVRMCKNSINKEISAYVEQATNLSDVPNKLDTIIKKCKKIAIFDLNQTETLTAGKNIIIKTNLDFIPEIAYVEIQNNNDPRDYIGAYYDGKNTTSNSDNEGYSTSVSNTLKPAIYDHELKKDSVILKCHSTGGIRITIKKLIVIG